MRIMVMAQGEEYRQLIRKHVEIEWPDSTVVDYRLDEEPPLHPKFAAAGFDAVVIVTPAPGSRAQTLAVQLAARAQFAPIVLVVLEEAPANPPAPQPGLQRLYGVKLDRQALLDALVRAAREQQQNQAILRNRSDYEQQYRFGDFTIRGHRCLRQLGAGGMSKVYLAESERAGTVVVLKIFSQVPDVSEKLTGFDRFLQEYQIVADLKHSNIVRIFDLGIADDHAYIAMEHFASGDLRQRMKVGLSPASALYYVEKIAGALEAIHAVGIQHRDLKPANIMLRADGSPCLIDFGLAKAGQFDLELTGTREIFGTPYYMSPEQGHAEDQDARSDLYSLGVIFYEMLVGKKPFLGGSAMEVIYKHKRTPVPEISGEIQRFAPVLKRMLAKSPGERFQSARELLDALAQLKAAG